MSEFASLSIGILGLGQIGGSLAAALSRRHQGEILGFDHRTELGREALNRGFLSRDCADAAVLIADADIVILALPIQQIMHCLESHAALLADRVLVTDTGSLKTAILATARSCRLDNFVGGHPLAGTEKRGIESWSAELFSGCSYFICDPESPALRPRSALAYLLNQLGAHPVAVAADEHDRVFATSSNLPHLLAYLLRTQFERENAASDRRRDFSCPSYRGATRVAASDPEMVFQMLWHNRANLSASLSSLQRSLTEAQKALDEGDANAFRRILGMTQRQDEP